MLGGVLPTCSSILPADECCHMVAIIPSRVSKAEFWYLSEESACVAIYGGSPFFRLFYSYGILWALWINGGCGMRSRKGFWSFNKAKWVFLPRMAFNALERQLCGIQYALTIGKIRVMTYMTSKPSWYTFLPWMNCVEMLLPMGLECKDSTKYLQLSSRLHCSSANCALRCTIMFPYGIFFFPSFFSCHPTLICTPPTFPLKK